MDIAVITGASSGMGKEFLKRLDDYNLDQIWIIARHKEVLDKLKEECKTNIKVLPLDLTHQESFDLYKSELEKDKPNIKYLFNCSGYGKFGKYNEIDLSMSNNMIDLNIKALVNLTEISLRYMSKGSKILEIASVAAFQPIPYIAIYGASKSFVLNYSLALSNEVKNDGISVTCLCPFWTKTGFFKRAKDTNAQGEVVTKYAAMYDVDFVVNKALKGLKKNKRVVIPGFISKVQCALVRILPKRFVMWYWIKQQKLDKRYKNKSN